MENNQLKLNDTLIPDKEFILEEDGVILKLINLQHLGIRTFYCIAVNDAGSETITFAIKTISKCF